MTTKSRCKNKTRIEGFTGILRSRSAAHNFLQVSGNPSKEGVGTTSTGFCSQTRKKPLVSFCGKFHLLLVYVLTGSDFMAFSSLSLHFNCFNDAGVPDRMAMTAAQHKTVHLLTTFCLLISFH